jgi:CheY-like chemotaxis protein
MASRLSTCPSRVARCGLDLARVLVVHDELAPRLTLQTVLQAGGYFVETAGTPAEALNKLDEGEFELVLSASRLGSEPAGRKVLAYARVKPYHPATALFRSYQPAGRRRGDPQRQSVSVQTENLPGLLDRVAELIGARASRRHTR